MGTKLTSLELEARIVRESIKNIKGKKDPTGINAYLQKDNGDSPSLG